MLVLAIEQDRRKYMGHDRRVQRKARPSSTHEQKLEEEYAKVSFLQAKREEKMNFIHIYLITLYLYLYYGEIT